MSTFTQSTETPSRPLSSSPIRHQGKDGTIGIRLFSVRLKRLCRNRCHGGHDLQSLSPLAASPVIRYSTLDITVYISGLDLIATRPQPVRSHIRRPSGIFPTMSELIHPADALTFKVAVYMSRYQDWYIHRPDRPLPLPLPVLLYPQKPPLSVSVPLHPSLHLPHPSLRLRLPPVPP